MRLIILLLTFFSFQYGFAQFHSGGMGYVSLGLSFNSFKSLSQNIRNSRLIFNNTPSLESSINIPTTGTQIGGGGFGLIHGKVILGGHGFANVFEDINISQSIISTSPDGTIEIVGGGGGFDIGLIAYNDKQNIVFPKLGLGGYGVSMEIENPTLGTMFYGNYEIEGRGREEFTMGSLYLDLGFQVHHLFGKSNDQGVGGFGLGLAVGYTFSVFDSGWESENQPNIASGLEDDAWNAFYIRLLIGGGGFSIGQ